MDIKKFSEVVEMETDRLRLRPWRDGDYEAFAALNADPAVMEFFPEPLDRQRSDALADRCRAGLEAHGWGIWAVENKATSVFTGLTGLNFLADEFSFSPAVEIGWRLSRPFWGRGLALEAAGAALAFGFQRLGLKEIVAFTTVGNTRSRALMERLNMAEDGYFSHPKLPADSPLSGHVLYRLSREAWLACCPV